MEEDRVERVALPTHKVLHHRDAVLPQHPHAFSGDQRVGVARTDHDAADPVLNDRQRAGRLFAVVAARLQRDIDRRAFRRLRERPQRVPLRVQFSVLVMPSLRDHAAALPDDGADHRIGVHPPLS